MEQLFFHDLKQNVTRNVFKKYFHDEKDGKSISYKKFCQ